MLANLTVARLISVSSVSGAPFLSIPDTKWRPQLLLSSLRFSRQFSSLLYATHLRSVNLSGGHFSHFLRSVVSLSGNEIQGVSEQSDSPARPDDSFVCTGATFINNVTPYSGAAISVSLTQLMNGSITESEFRLNVAGIGGAIFFANSAGSLDVSQTQFASNSAEFGSHLFLRCSKFRSAWNTYSFAAAGSWDQLSAIEVSEAGSFLMSGDNFFKNGAPINFILATRETTAISNCCFLRYTEAGPGKVEYNNVTISGTGEVSFTNTYINLVRLDGPVPIQNVTLAVSNATPLANQTLPPRAEECRVQPVQTLTPELKWGEAAWFSIVSILFFVIVSVVGIVVVTCSQNDKSGPLADRETGRDGSARRGRDDSDESLSDRD